MKRFAFGLLGTAVAVFGVAVEAQTQYETVVQDTSFNSASKVILDEEAIRKSKAPNIPALLATQANITVVNSNFQPSSIFLRGGDSGHILILVDGLPFYDASTVQKTFNLNDFDVRTVKRIEIIKGSQSVLYGGQALAGVIKIDTFPSELKNESSVLLEAGQREHRKLSIQGLKKLNDEQAVLVRGQTTEKNHRSPLKNSDQRYRSQLNTADLGYLYRSHYDVNFKASWIHDYSESATGFGATVFDTVGFENKNRHSTVMSGLRMPQSEIKPQLLVSYQNGNRSFEQSILNSPFGTEVDAFFGSKVLNIRSEIWPLNRGAHRLRLGVSYAKEDFIERTDRVETANVFRELTGVFAKYDQSFGDWVQFEGGVRSDFGYGQKVETFQAGVIFFEDLKIEYGTGFRTPSLFQTHAQIYGQNKDLKPETSRSLSLTYGKRIDDRQNVSTTLFETSFSDLIAFQGVPPTGKYVNFSKVMARGVEGQYTYRAPEQWRFDLNATYQEVWDVENSNWLPRRPLQSGNIRLSKEWTAADVGFEIVASGERRDQTTLPGHTLINAFYNRYLTDQVSGYVRGNNIMDQRYEQTTGYHDEGVFLLVGLEISN